jgi:GlpG protein
MRQAGTLDNKQDAQRFADYLLSLGITSKVEPQNGHYAIWVHDENHIPRSREELALFQAEPHAPRYQSASQAAQQARRESERKQRQVQRNYVDLRNRWESPVYHRGVTITLMALSLIVYVLQQFEPTKEYVLRYLLISTQRNSLPEIASGQLWRFLTPMFLHFGLLHIAFNMFMLLELGTLVERVLGSWRYLLIVLVLSVDANIAQFQATGPGFGGMSGVIYGLFGYAWIRGRLDPTCGLYLRPDLVFWMIGFFFLCAMGVIGNIANWAHGAGLLTGMALGLLSHLLERVRRNSRR